MWQQWSLLSENEWEMNGWIKIRNEGKTKQKGFDIHLFSHICISVFVIGHPHIERLGSHSIRLLLTTVTWAFQQKLSMLDKIIRSLYTAKAGWTRFLYRASCSFLVFSSPLFFSFFLFSLFFLYFFFSSNSLLFLSLVCFLLSFFLTSSFPCSSLLFSALSF